MDFGHQQDVRMISDRTPGTMGITSVTVLVVLTRPVAQAVKLPLVICKGRMLSLEYDITIDRCTANKGLWLNGERVERYSEKGE